MIGPIKHPAHKVLAELDCLICSRPPEATLTGIRFRRTVGGETVEYYICGLGCYQRLDELTDAASALSGMGERRESGHSPDDDGW